MGDGQLIIMVIVGAIAGGVSAALLRARGRAIAGSIVLGITGSVLAGFILPFVGVNLGTGMLSPVIHGILGAIMILVIPRFFKS